MQEYPREEALPVADAVAQHAAEDQVGVAVVPRERPVGLDVAVDQVAILGGVGGGGRVDVGAEDLGVRAC